MRARPQVAFLTVALLAAASAEAAAQWSVTAEVTATRFWGASSSSEDEGPSLHPYGTTLLGVGVEHAMDGVVLGLRSYYAGAGLALEGKDAVVALKDALHLYGVAPELSLGVGAVGSEGRLQLYAGPLVELWDLGETSHLRLGFGAALGALISPGGRWSAVFRVGGAVTPASPFAREDLEAGFQPRTLWRREVSGRLRFRL